MWISFEHVSIWYVTRNSSSRVLSRAGDAKLTGGLWMRLCHPPWTRRGPYTHSTRTQQPLDSAGPIHTAPRTQQPLVRIYGMKGSMKLTVRCPLLNCTSMNFE